MTRHPSDVAFDEALDLIESLIQQYMHYDGRDAEGNHFYSHDFMSVGEWASEWLPKYRPDRWKNNGLGLVPLFKTTAAHEAEHYTTMAEFKETAAQRRQREFLGGEVPVEDKADG